MSETPHWRAALAVLVCDLGYSLSVGAPRHGWHPIRHQLLWDWCQRACRASGEDFAEHVAQLERQAVELEGKDLRAMWEDRTNRSRVVIKVPGTGSF